MNCYMPASEHSFLSLTRIPTLLTIVTTWWTSACGLSKPSKGLKPRLIRQLGQRTRLPYINKIRIPQNIQVFIHVTHKIIPTKTTPRNIL